MSIFTKTDSILDDTTRLNNFKRIETTQSIFSAHNRIKLENNNRKITANFENIWNSSPPYLSISSVKE